MREAAIIVLVIAINYTTNSHFCILATKWWKFLMVLLVSYERYCNVTQYYHPVSWLHMPLLGLRQQQGQLAGSGVWDVQMRNRLRVLRRLHVHQWLQVRQCFTLVARLFRNGLARGLLHVEGARFSSKVACG